MILQYLLINKIDYILKLSLIYYSEKIKMKFLSCMTAALLGVTNASVKLPNQKTTFQNNLKSYVMTLAENNCDYTSFEQCISEN